MKMDRAGDGVQTRNALAKMSGVDLSPFSTRHRVESLQKRKQSRASTSHAAQAQRRRRLPDASGAKLSKDIRGVLCQYSGMTQGGKANTQGYHEIGRVRDQQAIQKGIAEAVYAEDPAKFLLDAIRRQSPSERRAIMLKVLPKYIQ